MRSSGPGKFLPSGRSALLALLSAVVLILAFPGFELWFSAWFALVPLLIAANREKSSLRASFVTGWLFGTAFFFGTCWWLTYSPIRYAGFPVLLAYFLLLCVCLVAGLFPAIFTTVLSILLRRSGTYAMLGAPFIWIFTEFLRFWTTGNNWNAIAYSQAFNENGVVKYADLGGIYLVGFIIVAAQAVALFLFLYGGKWLTNRKMAPAYIVTLIAFFGLLPFVSKDIRESAKAIDAEGGVSRRVALLYVALFFLFTLVFPMLSSALFPTERKATSPRENFGVANIIAIQPNVPMDGLTSASYEDLKRKHINLAEGAFDAKLSGIVDETLAKYQETDREIWTKIRRDQFQRLPKIVIFPESPMNFMYEEDKDFQEFVRAFAVKNNASVLFNAAEPDPASKKYFNSAVMVDAAGRKVGQYDKIYLVPFGETVPAPLQNLVPALVGSFSVGKEYDLLPFGDANGGVMICFESHFPDLSREYVRRGADVLIEMTNDGYLGPTPVLRQHLANAVFRAVETGRPVIRVTNVGISAYIDETGQVLEPTAGYTEDTRIWSVGRSARGQTLYVRFGDWFAWGCCLVTAVLLFLGAFRKRRVADGDTENVPVAENS